RQRLQAIGIELESEQALNDAFARFKVLADKKTEIFDEDLQALVSGEPEAEMDRFRLVDLAQSSEMGEKPVSKVVFSVQGREVTSEAQGNGPVDATVRAIEQEVKSGAELLLFSVNAITTGTESQGEVTMRLSKEGRVVNGVGADPDIVVASAKAYLNALNRLSTQPRVNPQQP
ncbi:MAG: hypothetical protein RLY67_666, partial [Pseudomonadota bacterium]